jgi:hypothetical protein
MITKDYESVVLKHMVITLGIQTYGLFRFIVHLRLNISLSYRYLYPLM